MSQSRRPEYDCIACSFRARFSSVIRIEVGQTLGRLRAAVGQDDLERYLVACAAVQFWADVLASCNAVGAMIDAIDNALGRAEHEADRTAQALLKPAAAGPAVTEDFPSTCIELRDSSAASMLAKALHLPVPECCGFNLADLQLIAGDCARLIGLVGTGRPILIVGVRTGGTYLAPLWRAALAELGVADVHWCTVRPRSDEGELDGLAVVQGWSTRRCAPVMVVVDDRPDTGATMERVAAMLRAPGIELWFSCVGNVWRGPAACVALTRPRASSVRGFRNSCLWKCLLPNEHHRFLDRLQEAPGLPALPDRARLQFPCPHGESRYGLGRAWLPWNHPHVLDGRRPLVNPRKTPILICGSGGEALFHLRFIGEGVFGRAECRRVQDMHPERRVWFIDGYAVTADIGSARAFRDHFHGASPSVRADLLAQTANWLTVMTRQVIARACGSPMATALGPRWSAFVRAMQERCGPVSDVPERVAAFLERPVPWLGRSGKAIRSSLRYSCGDWHWQVDRYGRLQRFQLEANWGDVSFPELELAVFALENRLSLEDTRHLAELCEIAYSSVSESLPLAALVIAEARVRSVRALSDSGRAALLGDFHQLLMTTAELAGFAAH